MSRPREATSVATRMLRSPVLNLLRAARRLGWDICPWIGTAPKPRLRCGHTHAHEVNDANTGQRHWHWPSIATHDADAANPCAPPHQRERHSARGVAGPREEHRRGPRHLREHVGQVAVLVLGWDEQVLLPEVVRGLVVVRRHLHLHGVLRSSDEDPRLAAHRTGQQTLPREHRVSCFSYVATVAPAGTPSAASGPCWSWSR